MTESVTLGGRVFHAADLERRTVRQDHFIERVLRSSGIDGGGPTLESSSADELLVRFRMALIDSGQACRLLSAFLLPEGLTERDWRVEIAAATEEYLGGLQDEADRQHVNELCIYFAAGFLERALRSFAPFLKSSKRLNGATSLQGAAHADH